MKRSKRQFLLLGLCAVGVAAFIYDRLQPQGVSGPDPALAAACPPAEPVGAAPAGEASPSGADVPLVRTKKILVDRLKSIAGESPASAQDDRDAFRPSAAWLPAAAAATPVAAEPTEKSKAEVFVQSHTLQAVMISGDTSQVVINDKFLKLGQEMDGFKLVSVSQERAVLRTGGANPLTVELTQKTADPGK
jgi:hypothetical protein